MLLSAHLCYNLLIFPLDQPDVPIWIAVVNAELLLFEGGKITAGACPAKGTLWTCKVATPHLLAASAVSLVVAVAAAPWMKTTDSLAGSQGRWSFLPWFD